MVTATTEKQHGEGVSQHRHCWFTTFQLTKQAGARESHVRCIGCREMIKLDYSKPAHIAGIIEYSGRYIPVIDPAILLLGRQSLLSNLSCILIIPHCWEQRMLCTGIMVEDIDEIIEFATTEPDAAPASDASVNIKFLLDMRRNPAAESWLYENHRALDICRNERQQELDYMAFKRLRSGDETST